MPVLDGVGDAVGGLVETGGGAVGGLVGGLGNTVSGAPKALKKATAPVTDALPVVKPVTDLLFGAADTLSSSAPRTAGDEDSSDSDEKSSSEESSSSKSKGLLGSLLGGGGSSEKSEKRAAGTPRPRATTPTAIRPARRELRRLGPRLRLRLGSDRGLGEGRDSGDGTPDPPTTRVPNGDSGGVVGAATGLVGAGSGG